MRIPYIEDPPPTQDAESAAIVNRVRDRRIAAGFPGLVELDRALLYSPPVADGWNSFLGAIRTKTNLSPAIRELIICRVASLNKASYEWKHHEPLLLDGLKETVNAATKEEEDALVSTIVRIVEKGTPDDFNELKTIDARWRKKAAAVMRYTDAMTTKVEVPNAVWDELEESCLNDENKEKEIVEITATCASYNCVSRFLVALHVGE